MDADSFINPPKANLRESAPSADPVLQNEKAETQYQGGPLASSFEPSLLRASHSCCGLKLAGRCHTKARRREGAAKAGSGSNPMTCSVVKKNSRRGVAGFARGIVSTCGHLENMSPYSRCSLNGIKPRAKATRPNTASAFLPPHGFGRVLFSLSRQINPANPGIW